MIPLGCIAKDRVTGLKGLVMARTDYLTNCTHVALCRTGKLTKDGKEPEWFYVDERRCDVVKERTNFVREEPVDIKAAIDSLRGGPVVPAPKR